MLRTITTLCLITLIIAASGCSANKPSEEKEIKKEQLEEYKKELSELKKKIAKLEGELGNDSPANLVNVELKELQPTLFEQFIEAVGNVSTDQNIVISPEVSGVIESIRIKEGQDVKKGQILAKLNTESIEQSIEEVKVNLELATTLYKRRKNLWEQNIGSEVEFLQAESNMNAIQKKLQGLEAQLEMAVIKAPINGVIDDLKQKQGEMAGPSIPFARLVNLDEVYITADVSEDYLNQINAEDSVSIYFPVLNVTKKAKIYRTSAVIDPDTRTFSIRVNLKNKDNALQPNLMGELKMRIARIPEALVVPSLLIKKDFKGEFVFVATNGDSSSKVAEKKYISTSIKDNNSTVVTKGLESGMKIITKGYAQVTDGTPLNINE
ncbi:efflux RND transporter periplasmic adaptor subunit [Marinilabilia rubra]|uniref:Efflux RND transporter periplasmic adaptor subunit n=1 Tax=Marinilabilia rubra TaxID=2162893 RepID=A0A2U2B8X2_9BACT|nr:efflux RND transporter periplasmic adaptor subunit [Marinilabilia rubra]PWD99531.1 efflux RND transporter periplasmic adaptor subunit [Marinilabilia rubra]